MVHSGSCFCGEVTFTVSGTPEAQGYCHCTSCRTWSAGPVNAFTLWKPDALKITHGAASIGTLALTLLLVTPILSLLGALGAALTLGLRSGAALVFLLVLPLTIPALIFGTGAVGAVDSGLSPQAHLSVLAALLIFTALGAPLATAAALRIALD